MEQQTIFDMLYPKLKIDKPIRLIELFAGYGSQALALKYLGVNFEHWKICEWAVKSIQAYKDLHFTDDDVELNPNRTKEDMIEFLYQKGISADYNKPMTKDQIKRLSEEQLKTIIKNIAITHNLVNIQQVKGKDLEIKDTNLFTYLLTYSFPCQDLSLAGKKQGMTDTSTRSGLLWEVERILTELDEKPQVLLMENVPQVHNQENMQDFFKWQNRLEELGYKNYWQDLIATDYGIPQIRNRTFMVSILGDYNYAFPKPTPLKLKLKDMLEDNAGEKYFLSEKCIKTMLKHDVDYQPSGLAPTLTTELSHHTGKNLTPKVIREIYNAELEKYYLSNKMIDYITSADDKYIVNENKLVINRDIACSKTTREGNTRADSSDYICKELPENTNLKQFKMVTGGGNTPIIPIKNKTNKGYLEAEVGDGIDISSRMEHHRGTVQKGKAQTLTTMGGENNGVIANDLRIRKLTPKECFRLMGVKDKDYERIAKNQSDSSLYHLAGDSIVVNVLMAIFNELLQ